ncbi:DPP IV N-terminal domain-containing protein [bacterium]|nr:DPP IV N-terminal domain-containing protein [bacterium]
MKRLSLLIAVVLALPLLTAPAQEHVLTVADYDRAWSMTDRSLYDLVDNRILGSGWLDSGRFWYDLSNPAGHTVMIVNPVDGVSRELFDHTALAAALSELEGEDIPAANIPMQRMSFSEDEKSITFGRYSYSLETGELEKITAGERTGRGGRMAGMRRFFSSAADSPDGTMEVFIREYNLWLRNKETKEEVQLTTDGVEDFGYATNNAGWTKSDAPVLLWSPDSKKIATFQQDARGVGDMYLVSTTVGHPELEAWKYDLPGDEHIFRVERVIIHLDPLKVVRLNMAPDAQRSTITDHIAGRGGQLLDAQWSDDGSQLAFVSTSRDHKTVTLRIADPGTGEIRDVLTETQPTWFESGFSDPNWRIFFDRNEFFWWSQRDDWGHLYLYDLKSGRLKRQITKGEWNMKEIVRIDHEKGLLWFIGTCREPGNPYHEYFYRIGLNGKGLTCLTPEQGHHRVTFSPDNKYMIDTWSSVEKPAVTVLRTMDGTIIATLAEEDITRLKESGWPAPELIEGVGRDGKTKIYGILNKPSDFDPAKKYPIINSIYPGPQSGSIGSFAFTPLSSRQSLAELGFIVVAINGMGTPGRSKSFHDTYYGNMGDNTLPDQIAVMKQLAEKYSWIDIDRVGIYGHSGGGYAAADAIMRYPNFFKVAVSRSGNHDNRVYEAPWGEKWQGLLTAYKNGTSNYDNQANQLLAKNLKGKLLLVHGMMDDNVPPYSTLLVVQELIKENKDFDLLLFPGSRHGYRYGDYMTRRQWDYFVKYLLGAEPPKEYDFTQRSN